MFLHCVILPLYPSPPDHLDHGNDEMLLNISAMMSGTASACQTWGMG